MAVACELQGHSALWMSLCSIFAFDLCCTQCRPVDPANASTPAAHEGAVLPVAGLEHKFQQRQLVPIHLCRGQARGVSGTLSAIMAASSRLQDFMTCSSRAKSSLFTCENCPSDLRCCCLEMHIPCRATLADDCGGRCGQV